MTERRVTPERRAWPREGVHRGRRREDREFYSPQEVGNMVGFSASFIVGEIKAGECPAVFVKPANRTRGRWRIAVVDALAYVKRLTASRV